MYKVYTDGCFNKNKTTIGWGFVITDGEQIVYESKGEITDPNLTPMYQVPGEIISVVEAVDYCIHNNINSIVIYHDYKGISDWVTGEWKAKNSFTKQYVEYMSLASEIVNFSFNKVKSHSGDYFNDYADKLAKIACGIIK